MQLCELVLSVTSRQHLLKCIAQNLQIAGSILMFYEGASLKLNQEQWETYSRRQVHIWLQCRGSKWTPPRPP